MKPYISVLIPTTRCGGLDVLFSSLELQKFKNFELILMDTLFEKRKDLVAQKAKDYSFIVKHLPQRNTAIHYCETMNSGLIQADGEIIYTMCDHTWIDKDCLQEHANFHRSKLSGQKYALIGHFADCKLPKLHKDFYRTYAPNIPYYREDKENQYTVKERECYNNYIEDIESGKLDSMMWSIYETPFTTDTDPNTFEITLPKPILPVGEVESNNFILKNESYVLDDVLVMNGFNEALDGAHGWQDWDFADRFTALTGTKLFSNSYIKTYTMNPRNIMYARKRDTDMFKNEEVWEEGKRTQFKNPINSYSVREIRQKRIMTKNKPYISIICPTMRLGGLDTLFNSLERQTFKDFELIISDSLYQYRKDIVADKIKQYSFRCKHIAPINDKFPIFSQSHAVNSGIVQAEGDVILFTTDYRYFMPETLQKHADFHRQNADNVGYAPGSKFLLPPTRKEGVPSYGRNDNYSQYIEDLKSGKLNEYMWSIFANDIFSNPQDFSTWQEIDRLKIGYDPKIDIQKGDEVPPHQIFTQSESVKTKIVLAANGFNEALDGAFNYMDIEFAYRLHSFFDFKWIGDNTNPIYRITGGDKIIDKAQLIQEVQDVAESICRKYENGSKDPVNTWSLSKVHSDNQNKMIRESTIEYFGRNFKAVDWHLIPGNNGSDDPWLDEESIRQKHWNSFSSGQVVIDIGACFGLYTLPALMQGCRVIAFEPNIEFANQIAESVAMNEGFSKRYQCHNIGLWNKTVFPSELEKPVLDWCKIKTLPLTTLDEITKNMDRVDMIKMDVEGAEAGVMEAAIETIKRYKPSFLIEDHTGLYSYPDLHKTREKILSILAEHNYTVQMELFGGPPPPGGGRWFIIAHPPNKTEISSVKEAQPISVNNKLKLAFLFGAWSIGSRPLDMNNFWTSSRGATGSDLGVCITAREMAKMGHDVSLFTVYAGTQQMTWEGVKLLNISEKNNIDDSFDAVISWSEPDILRDLPKKPVKIVCQMLNDFTYCQPGYDNCVDLWTAPCQMLINHLTSQANSPPKEKFVVLPLGCETSWYQKDQKVSGRVVWTSSADRGLHNLLQEWPKIKASAPHATLRIFYNFNYSSVEGMEPNSSNHPHFLEMGHRARYMKEAIKKLKDLGVEHIGSVSRERMQQELSEAEVFAFPCDTIAFSEGFSVSTLEAHASGTVPIITDMDCLGEVYKNSGAIVIKDIKHNLASFTQSVIRALNDKSFASGIVSQCQKFAKEHTWTKSTQKLETIIKDTINTRK